MTPRISRLALASFICGIAAVVLFFVGPILGLPAILLGALALRKINNHPAHLGGKGFALTGVSFGALGIVSLSLIAVAADTEPSSAPATRKGSFLGLGSARASANAATCMTNLRQIGVASMAFAAEHNGKLPGNRNQFLENGKDKNLETNGVDKDGLPALVKPQNAWQADWLAGVSQNLADRDEKNQKATTGFFAQPTRGTIYPYLNTVKALRCPELAFDAVAKGTGSNGQFDYSMPQVLNGTRVDRVARTATVTSGNSTLKLATPFVVEEDPANGLNKAEKGESIDGAFCKKDSTTFNHKDGTNIMTLDGSAFWFIPGKNFTVTAAGMEFTSTAPTQAKLTAEGNDTAFGWFNTH